MSWNYFCYFIVREIMRRNISIKTRLRNLQKYVFQFLDIDTEQNPLLENYRIRKLVLSKDVESGVYREIKQCHDPEKNWKTKI